MFLSDKDFTKYYDEFASKAELAPASHFESGIWSIIDGLYAGDKINFLGSESEKIQFRKGEVTVVAGASGHGKSAFTGQVALDLALQDHKACIMSFEMKPERTLWRIVRQALGSTLTKESSSEFYKNVGNRLLVLNHIGSASPKLVYGAIIKAVREENCEHIFVDNLMKVVSEYGEGANEEQKKFIETLCSLARAFDIHIWLVCHVRKGMKEIDQIDKYSIRGSTSITDQVDNVILFSRNLAKEKQIAEKGFSAEIDDKTGDQQLIIDKQRNGEWQGVIQLWWERTTGRYCPSPDRFFSPIVPTPQEKEDDWVEQ